MADGTVGARRPRRGPRPRARPRIAAGLEDGPRDLDPPRAGHRADHGAAARPPVRTGRPADGAGAGAGAGVGGWSAARLRGRRRGRGSAGRAVVPRRHRQAPADVRRDLRGLRDSTGSTSSGGTCSAAASACIRPCGRCSPGSSATRCSAASRRMRRSAASPARPRPSCAPRPSSRWPSRCGCRIPWSTLSLLQLLPLALVQRAASAAALAAVPGADPNTRLTPINWVGVAFGVMLLLLTALAATLPPALASRRRPSRRRR